MPILAVAITEVQTKTTKPAAGTSMSGSVQKTNPGPKQEETFHY